MTNAPFASRLFAVYSLSASSAQKLDLGCVAGQFVGGFQDEGQVAKRGVRDDALERVDADEALADAFVAVLVRPARGSSSR